MTTYFCALLSEVFTTSDRRSYSRYFYLKLTLALCFDNDIISYLVSQLCLRGWIYMS